MNRYLLPSVIAITLIAGVFVTAPRFIGSAQENPTDAETECIWPFEDDPTDPSGNAANIESLSALWAAVLPYESDPDTAVFPPDTILDQPLETTMAATIELAARDPGVGAVVTERYGTMIEAYLESNPDALLDSISGRADYWLAEHGYLPWQDGAPPVCEGTPDASATPTTFASPTSETASPTADASMPTTEPETATSTATVIATSTSTTEPTATEPPATATQTQTPVAMTIPVTNDSDDGGVLYQSGTFTLASQGGTTVRVGDLTSSFRDYGAYVRFAGVGLPAADGVDNLSFHAYLNLTVAAVSGQPFNTVISVSANPNAAAYTTVAEWNAETLVPQTALWPANSGWTAGQTVQTVDVSSLVMAVLSDPAWVPGSSLMFRITDMSSGNQGSRFDFATRENPTLAEPTLYIEYTPVD